MPSIGDDTLVRLPPRISKTPVVFEHTSEFGVESMLSRHGVPMLVLTGMRKNVVVAGEPLVLTSDMTSTAPCAKR